MDERRVTRDGTQGRAGREKFYGATVKFEVSTNTRGTFSLELNSHPAHSLFRNVEASPILPVNFEALRVEVLTDPARVIKGLNRSEGMADAQVDVNRDGARNFRDLLYSIEALNASD